MANSPTDTDAALHAPVRALGGVQVLATGSYVPECVVTNADLQALGVDPQWIVQRTGIAERRRAPDDMATSDMAVLAARRCLASAGVSPGEVDLLVLATFTSDWMVPSSACVVQNALGLRAPAVEVEAACSGFMYALVTAMQFVATGCSRRALVIGADCNTRVVDPAAVKMYPLFGDGAGAVLLGPGTPEQGLLAYTLGADGSGAELLCRPMGGSRTPPTPEGLAAGRHYLQMDGRAVFKWAVRVLEVSVGDVLGHAGMTVGDLDLVILHQANLRIIQAAVELLGLPPDKMQNNLERYGNTSAASIPLALDEACAAGRVRRGDRLLLSGYGAGLAWGTAVLRW